MESIGFGPALRNDKKGKNNSKITRIERLNEYTIALESFVKVFFFFKKILICNKYAHYCIHYLSLEFALLLAAIVGEDFESWAPTFQLHLPIEHYTGGHNDQMWTPVTCKRNRENVCQTTYIHYIFNTHHREICIYVDFLPFTQAR